MKKLVLLTLAVFLSWSPRAVANPVSKSDALQKAAQFLESRGKSVTGSLVMADGPKKAKANREAAPYYYVVNNGQDDGFVIIAGDDRAKTVLGYADSGHFDQENMPEMVAELLNGYVEEMESYDEMGIGEIIEEVPEGITERAKTKTPTTNAIMPLVTTEWGQDEPYNCACPLMPNSTNVRAYVGCGGVTIAQLIYYYRSRMEANLKVAIPGYTCTTYQSDYRGYVKAPSIAAGTAFNWGSMYEKYTSSVTATQKTNTGKFLSYVAIAMQSDFGDTYTSSSVSAVIWPLVKFFNFKTSNTSYLSRDAYTYAQWKAMLLEELNQKRPVVYYGKSKSAAHLFLVDGFDGGDLFHINWGWGGHCNGYFTLTTLSPYDLDGYNANITVKGYLASQRAFFDLQPSKGYSNTDGNTNLTATINKAASASATITFANKTTNAGTYYYGLGYYDDNGNIKLVKQASTVGVIMEPQVTSVVAFNLSYTDFGVSKTTSKTFKVYPICKLKDDDEWRQCEQTSKVYYLKAVCNGSVTLSVETETANLVATNFTYPGTKVKGVNQPVIVTVTNNGADFNGIVYLFAVPTSYTTKGDIRSTYQFYLPAGQSVDLNLNFTPGNATTYNVWATTNSSGSNVIGQSTVKIVASSATRNLGVTSFALQNVKTENTVYGKSLRGSAVIKNSSSIAYYDNVYTQLYYYSGSSWRSTTTRQEDLVSIPAGGSTTINFAFDELNPSTTYAIVFKYADEKYLSSNFIYRYCKVTDGVMCYKPAGDLLAYAPSATFTVPEGVTAVDLTGLTKTVTKVVPNSNPNTLYFYAASESPINGTVGKNVVKGTVAESITLTDKMDFYTPKDITAKSITYTRVPAIGTSGQDGWQTIVLPFAPTKITCNGNQLDWFRGAKDTMKNFWLKDFAAIEGASKVAFGYAQSFEANHPYLIAVPGSKWGAVNNLVGKSIVFTGQNAVLYENPAVMTGSDVYNFRGSYVSERLANTFVLNATGTKFAVGNNDIVPFRCYFIAVDKDLTNINELNIGSFEADETDGIFMPFAEEREVVDVYDLRGVKVGRVQVVNAKIDIESLPKGVYVIKGKKMVKY